jgi:Ca2+-binding EF-hand superfamily protein
VDELYDYLNYSEFDEFNPEKEVFALLDPNNSGVVDFNQLDQMMELFGYQPVSKEMLQKVLGTDSKEITFETFKRLMSHAEPVHDH